MGMVGIVGVGWVCWLLCCKGRNRYGMVVVCGICGCLWGGVGVFVCVCLDFVIFVFDWCFFVGGGGLCVV